MRGLDYYNSTVFEWKVSGFGAQDTICGGGRYDALVPLLGGPHRGLWVRNWYGKTCGNFEAILESGKKHLSICIAIQVRMQR